MNRPKAPDRISFAHRADPVFPRDTCGEVEGDVYVMSSPLCHGRALLESDGCLLHDGAVYPGMLRIASPGERVRALVLSPSRAAVLTFPGQAMRTVLAHEGHNPGRWSFFDPLLRPDHRVQRICETLLTAGHVDLKQRQLFIDGLAHALLACLLQKRLSRRPVEDRGLSDKELARAVEFADSMTQAGLELHTVGGYYRHDFRYVRAAFPDESAASAVQLVFAPAD